MDSVKYTNTGVIQQLSDKQRHVFFALLFMLISGGPAVSLLLAKITPEADAGIYVFAFTISCIYGHFFLFWSAKIIRARYVAFFSLALAAALLLGVQGYAPN